MPEGVAAAMRLLCAFCRWHGRLSAVKTVLGFEHSEIFCSGDIRVEVQSLPLAR